MDAAGTRILQQRHPVLDEGASAWAMLDVATGATTPLALGDEGWWVVAVAADLSAVIQMQYDPVTYRPVAYRRLDLAGGDTTPLGLAAGDAESVLAFSPSLRTAVVRGPLGNSFTLWAVDSFTLWAVDVATGATVLEPRWVTREQPYAAILPEFLDERTVLLDDVRPAEEGQGPVVTDDAFLLDVLTGATVRVDPGAPVQGVVAATPDGARTISVSYTPIALWLSRPGEPLEQLPGSFDVVATPDLSVIVSTVDGEAFVTCV